MLSRKLQDLRNLTGSSIGVTVLKTLFMEQLLTNVQCAYGFDKGKELNKQAEAADQITEIQHLPDIMTVEQAASEPDRGELSQSQHLLRL